MRKITPSLNKHFKNINTGDIYEGDIYLGIYDSPYNYVEVSEEEYQASLKPKATFNLRNLNNGAKSNKI